MEFVSSKEKKFEGLRRRVRIPQHWLRTYLPHFFIAMNNEQKNGNVTVCMVRRPRTKARAVTMDLFGAMQRNDVKLQEVLVVLDEAVKGFLMPLGRNLGFEEGEIIKAFGRGLMNTEPAI